MHIDFELMVTIRWTRERFCYLPQTCPDIDAYIQNRIDRIDIHLFLLFAALQGTDHKQHCDHLEGIKNKVFISNLNHNLFMLETYYK